MEYSALDVSYLIIEEYERRNKTISNLRLQKILYFVQADFLVNKNRPCFYDDIEAWSFGPVVPDVYHKFEAFGGSNIVIGKHETVACSKNDLSRIQDMITRCLLISTPTLTNLTFYQNPWTNNFVRDKHQIIPKVEIYEFFKENNYREKDEEMIEIKEYEALDRNLTAEDIIDLVKSFPECTITQKNELIIHKKMNLFIMLDNIETKKQLAANMLQWLSREASESYHYSSEKKNNKYRNFVLDGINHFLNTNFTQDDMRIIYCNLGGGANRDLAFKFIDSGYDFRIILKHCERTTCCSLYSKKMEEIEKSKNGINVNKENKNDGK